MELNQIFTFQDLEHEFTVKYAKAYILLKTKTGRESEFINRVEEFGLKYYGIYSLFGQYNLLVELIYNDWQDLDDFMYALQTDIVLRDCVIFEVRLISHEKNFEIEDKDQDT
ncbi:MAG: hypothetical protein ACTSRA_01495 [Promethearchaeota archaeon]